MTLSEFINNYDSKKFIDPFIIAEAGVNHEGDINTAKRLIDMAKEGGADAIKFQSYKANKIAVRNSPSYWDLGQEPTKSQFELFNKYDKFWKKEYVELKEHCDKVKIEFLSTPFDLESAGFLNDLMGVYKISSSDLNNQPFIEKICEYKKPIILSTGASYYKEIKKTVNLIKSFGNKLALLHCVLNYPTLNKNANLEKIKHLNNLFPRIPIGYSDHTLPKNMQILEIASILGACIIEKHFTHDKNLKGNDHYHSMDYLDLKKFKKRIAKIKEIIGNSDNEVLETEKVSRVNARRSLVSARFIPSGKVIQEDDLTWKRPGTGIEPSKINELIGKKAKLNIEEDTILINEFFTSKN